MKILTDVKRLILYAVVLTAAVIWASFQGGTLPYACLFFVLLYIPVSLALCWYAFSCFSMYQSLSEYIVTKRTEYEYQLVMENIGFLRINDVELLFEDQKSSIHGGKEPDHIQDGTAQENAATERKGTESPGPDKTAIWSRRRLCLLPGEKKILKGFMSCRYAGTYQAGLLYALFPDMFGIVRLQCPVRMELRAVVRPGITAAAQEALDFENLVNSAGHKSLYQDEPLPGSDMRDYQHGESVRQVNWKVSAGRRKLTVRLPDRQETMRVILVMVADPDYGASPDMDRIRGRDWFLEFAVSAAHYFASRGQELLVWYPRGRCRSMLVSSRSGFLDFYEEISKGVFYDSPAVMDELRQIIIHREEVSDDTGGYSREVILGLYEREYPDGHFLEAVF